MAERLGHDESNERWNAFADRIWNEGILPTIATSRDKSPGLFDPESGRFLNARRLSKLRGFWTENPDFLIEHSPTLDITALSLAVPFGLLPASDPRLIRTAEAILRAHEAQRGDPNVLGRSTYEPAGSSWSGAGNDSHDVSSQATFWMVRFLAEARPRNRSSAVLDQGAGAFRRHHQSHLAPRAFTTIIRTRDGIRPAIRPTPVGPPQTFMRS